MAVITKYQAPFEGMITAAPPVVIPPQAAVLVQDFMYRNGYIVSRPPLVLLPSTNPADGKPIEGICTSYQQKLTAQPTYYIAVFTTNNIYSYNGPPGGYTLIAPLPAVGTPYIFDYINALASTIFVNGARGVYELVISPTSLVELTGGLYGAHYIMELAQTILIANTVESDGVHPQRLRWCSPTDITVWDPNANVGAGFNDLLDCSDIITGMFAVGSIGYVVRTNGVTQVTPTGDGIQPWTFNHLWASQQGIGQIFPQTIAQYGSLTFILALDNVYTFTSSALNTIGDAVINDIVTDIAVNNPSTRGPFYPNNVSVFASISPKYTVSYRQFCYKIFICNQTTHENVVWSFDLTTKAWTREEFDGYLLTAQPRYATQSTPGTSSYEAFFVPTSAGLLMYDTTTNNTDIDNTYVFKTEQRQDLTYNSVSQVAVRYANIDTAELTVTLVAPGSVQSQTLVIGDSTQSKAYYNGGTVPLANNDGASYVAIFSFHPVTDESFNVVLTRSANLGGVWIEQVTVYGESQEESR